MPSSFPIPRPLCLPLGAGALLLALAAGAKADTIQLRLGSLDDVQVTGIKDGKVQYKNPSTGNVGERSLGEIKGIQVEGVPAATAAMAALASKDDKAAVGKLNEALRVARASKQKAWLVPYLQYKLLGCHKRLGDELAAAHVFCEMAQGKADLYFFNEPLAAPNTKADPALEDIVKAADENARKAIHTRVKDVRKSVSGDLYLAQLDRLDEATGIKDEAPPVSVPAPGTGGTPTPPVAVPGTTAPAVATPAVTVRAGALVLPARVLRLIQENSAETGDMQLAVAGRYSDAAKAMNGALLAKQEFTGARLFVLGRVQQELAEKESDAAKKDALLKEAAICFGRVGAHFHEEDSGYYYPALLEFARIYQALGHAEISRKLMPEVAPLGDLKDEPAYVARYNEFKAVLDKP